MLLKGKNRALSFAVITISRGTRPSSWCVRACRELKWLKPGFRAFSLPFFVIRIRFASDLFVFIPLVTGRGRCVTYILILNNLN